MIKLRDLRSDVGTTLAELLVAMFLFGIVGLLVATTAIFGQQVTASTATRMQNTDQARLGIDEMSRQLRSSIMPDTNTPAFCTARVNEVLFYSNYGLGTGVAPTLRHFYVDSNKNLIEQSRPAQSGTVAACTNTSWSITHTVATSVDVNVSHLFDYYAEPASGASDGALIATTGSPAAVASADLTSIDSIQITVVADARTGHDVPSATLATRVRLPNKDLVGS